MSKNELADVRAWLLEAERYEDVIQFDGSDEAKERLCNEFYGSDYENYSVDSDTKKYIEYLKDLADTFKKLYNVACYHNKGLTRDVTFFVGQCEDLRKERDELRTKLNENNHE